MNPSRETKFSGTYGATGIFIFPVQLTTSRIGNLTRLIHAAICDEYSSYIYTYIHTVHILLHGHDLFIYLFLKGKISVRVTAPRFELTSQRQKVSRLSTEPPGPPVITVL